MSTPQLAIETQLSAVAREPQVSVHEDIQRRAYQLWQTRVRHGGEGTAEQDWITAEQELSAGSAITEQPDV